MKALLLVFAFAVPLSQAHAGDIMFSCAATHDEVSTGLIVYADAHGYPLMHVYETRGNGPLVIDRTASVERTELGYRSISSEHVFNDALRLERQPTGGYVLWLNQGFGGVMEFSAVECK